MINYREAILKLDKKEIVNFLERFNLKFEKDIDYTIIAEDDNGIIATGSLAENVLKCFAIDSNYQGMAISNTIISKLIDKAYSLNRNHLFIFTKPENENIFKDFGFKEVAKVEEVVLLDNKIECLYKILDELKNNEESGVIVVNANPMTKGHLKLIEHSSKLVEKLYVIVVSEDKSIFPFKFRYEVVKQACEHISNVEVIKGNDYIISRNTFPTYFYKDSKMIIDAYTKLDISIFAKYFAKSMNIKKRFVGTETTDVVTEDYNQKMKQILPKYGIELVEIDRFKQSDQIISASTVRKLIKENKFEEAKKLVPEATIKALQTKEGQEIIERLQKIKQIEKLLAAKEDRYNYQKELVKKYNNTLISFMLNIPGEVKSSPKTIKFQKKFIDEIKSILAKKGARIIFQDFKYKDTGDEYFAVVDKNPIDIKKLMIDLEELNKECRLLDIDVFDKSMNQISRQSLGFLGRKCLICEKEAKYCMRTSAHTTEELIEETNKLLEVEL